MAQNIGLTILACFEVVLRDCNDEIEEGDEREVNLEVIGVYCFGNFVVNSLAATLVIFIIKILLKFWSE